MTTIAASTAASASTTSAWKSAYPGVSTIVIRIPSCSSEPTARLMLWLRLCSSGSQSRAVVPASTVPSRAIAPASKSIASARLVLPAPPW